LATSVVSARSSYLGTDSRASKVDAVQIDLGLGLPRKFYGPSPKAYLSTPVSPILPDGAFLVSLKFLSKFSCAGSWSFALHHLHSTQSSTVCRNHPYTHDTTLNMADEQLHDFASLFSLKGKVAVVTGGSRGLGLSAASA
jgi:hypothetical protein